MLGRYIMSKALTVAHFNEPRDAPVRAFLCLRAWSLGRLREVPSFLAEQQSRRLYDNNELSKLKTDINDIRATNDKTITGCAYSDELIKTWCPEALG